MGPEFPAGEASRIIRLKIRALCKPPLYRSSDHDDVQQEVLLHLAKSWPRFDLSRGEAGAFLAAAIVNKINSMTRREAAAKRGRLRTRRLEDEPLSACRPLLDAAALHKALSSLPPELADVAAAILRAGSVAGAARLLGIPRSTLRDRLRDLRERLSDFGPAT